MGTTPDCRERSHPLCTLSMPESMTLTECRGWLPDGERECGALLQEARRSFATAGLRHVQGFAPPAWSAPPSLCEALNEADFHFVTSARDLDTPVSQRARTARSGLHGASLIHPMWIRCAATDESTGATAVPCRLVHFTTNFQATSTIERALTIIECGGLLAIKAHIFKTGGGITMLDGLD